MKGKPSLQRLCRKPLHGLLVNQRGPFVPRGLNPASGFCCLSTIVFPKSNLNCHGDTPWSDLSMAAGHFEWEIPAKWKVGDTGTEHSFPGWVQEFDLDGDGTLSIGKFGRGVTRTTADEITIE